MDSLLSTSSPSQQPIIKDQATPPPQAKSPDEVVVLDSGGGERRPSRFRPGQVVAEQLSCPRCDSTNTKFCYYNNYNLSQPRHFCKSCRRYWTRGGALRNIPVGGATRKPSSSNKRPLVATTATPPAAAAPTSSNSNSDNLVSCTSDNNVTGQTRALEPVFPDPVPALAKSVSSNFWLSSAQMGLGGGLLPFNGYGIGLGPLVGDESRVLDWSMEPVVAAPGRSTWQMGGDDAVEGGERAEADYFSWPELAISKPAEALK